jgi:hypothetical protein
MLIRHGVKLSPKLADVFDMIERAGKRGITRETLAWVFYPGKSKRDAERCISVTINHINEFLEETDVHVSTLGRRLEPYRVVHGEQS